MLIMKLLLRLLFGLFYSNTGLRAHMTGAAASEIWIFSSQLAVATITGSLVRRMIGHEKAHGIALSRTLERVAKLIGTGGIAVGVQPFMMAVAAFDTFVIRMLEGHMHQLGCSIVQFNGLCVFEQTAFCFLCLDFRGAEQGKDKQGNEQIPHSVLLARGFQRGGAPVRRAW